MSRQARFLHQFFIDCGNGFGIAGPDSNFFRATTVSFAAIVFLHPSNLKNKVPLVSLNPSRFPAGRADLIVTVQTEIVLLGVIALLRKKC
jgi:hypothetical protein